MMKGSMMLVAFLYGCGSPCAQLQGAWIASFANSCGSSAAVNLVIAQNGCDYTGQSQPTNSIFSGSIDGTMMTGTITFGEPCTGTATASATIQGDTVQGTYKGTSSCCPGLYGTVSMQRSP
jgi:hypothetical protein